MTLKQLKKAIVDQLTTRMGVPASDARAWVDELDALTDYVSEGERYTGWRNLFDCTDFSDPQNITGMIDPPYMNTDGRLSRTIAIIIPGSVLSQPAKVTSAS